MEKSESNVPSSSGSWTFLSNHAHVLLCLAESLEAVQALRNLLPQNMVMRNVIPRDDLFVRASAKGLPVGVMEEGAGVQ